MNFEQRGTYTDLARRYAGLNARFQALSNIAVQQLSSLRDYLQLQRIDVDDVNQFFLFGIKFEIQIYANALKNNGNLVVVELRADEYGEIRKTPAELYDFDYLGNTSPFPDDNFEVFLGALVKYASEQLAQVRTVSQQ